MKPEYITKIEELLKNTYFEAYPVVDSVNIRGECERLMQELALYVEKSTLERAMACVPLHYKIRTDIKVTAMNNPIVVEAIENYRVQVLSSLQELAR